MEDYLTITKLDNDQRILGRCFIQAVNMLIKLGFANVVSSLTKAIFGRLSFIRPCGLRKPKHNIL